MKHKRLVKLRNRLIIGLMAVPIVVFSLFGIILFQPLVWFFSDLSWKESGVEIITFITFAFYGVFEE